MRPCSQTTDTRRDASVAVVLCGGSVHACGGPHHQPHQEDIRAVEPATSRARSVPGQLVSRTRAPHQRNPSRAQRCVAAYCTCRGAGRTPHKPCTRVVSVGNDMRVGYRTLSEAICSSFGTTRQRISGLYRKSVRARVIPCAHHVFWCTVTWVCHVSGRSWGCGARLGIWYRPARPPNTPGPAATSHGGEPVACISGHGGFYWSGEAHMQTRAVCRSVAFAPPHSLCGDPTVRQSTGISPAQAAWCCEAVPIRVNQAFILACSSTPAVRQPCEWCCQRCQKQGRPSHRSPIPDADTRSRAAHGCELDTGAHSSRTRRRVAAV